MNSILRAGEGRLRRRIDRLTEMVLHLDEDFAAMSDADLRAMTGELQQRLTAGENVDSLLPEAFATVREAAHRVLGLKPYPVQVAGAVALHLGNIAEMRTGEGKTLVTTMPAYLNALSGRGVHVVTVNDYLATRDAAAMGPVHAFLGLNVGVITADADTAERSAAYACDITYGTNNELGFDYLRDNMAENAADVVQRGHHYAIVDEADSILIDEARTPLILSSDGAAVTHWHAEFARVARLLVRDEHYEVDEKKRTVGLNESGAALVHDTLGVDSLFTPQHARLVGQLNQALRAKELYLRDKDYVVIDGAVQLVDEHTGRVLDGRRFSDGLHQALEAKEGVSVQPENQTLAAVTLQNYFRLYSRLSGLTGTAASETAELAATYQLGVLTIPTHRPAARVDHPDLIYRDELAKFTAVVADVLERAAGGQPVLVGTTSVEKSELLSQMLSDAGVGHVVLNAKQHEREAHVIAQAGRAGAVTVATNMAGRGTDILLGGNPEELAAAELAGHGLTPDSPEWEQRWPGTLEQARDSAQQERDRVLAAGGLYVIGTERHESRRIDEQLRGRSGRQGDPGMSRFYLSLEDDLVRRFAGGMLTRAVDALGAGDRPIESGMVNRSVTAAQRAMEAQNYQQRKDVVKYDDVLDRQRHAFYGERSRALASASLGGHVRGSIPAVVAGLVQEVPRDGAEWDLPAVLDQVRTVVPLTLSLQGLVDALPGPAASVAEEADLLRVLTADAEKVYLSRIEQLGPELAGTLERAVFLAVCDRAWVEHLATMEHLREGIHMRALAQRDPLVEYQREGYELYLAMIDRIHRDTLGFVLNVELPTPTALEEELDSLVLDLEEDELSGPAGEVGDPERAPSTDPGRATIELVDQLDVELGSIDSAPPARYGDEPL